MSRYNPERRAWRGRSYRKGGQLVRHLRSEVARAKGHYRE